MLICKTTDLTNFLISTQQKWNPIFTRVRVKMTADVIEWLKSDTLTARSEIIVVENDIIEKQIYQASSSEKIARIKQFYSCPDNKILVYEKGFTELKLGDVVLNDQYDEYGIVIEIRDDKALVEFYYDNFILFKTRTIKPKYLKKN